MGEETLFYVNTYKNDNITNDDIMLSFKTQIEKYTQSYFIVNYKIFDAKEEQNYAWFIKTTKQIYGWGIVYNIRLHFSNGWVNIEFSNSSFSSSGKSSQYYYLYPHYGLVMIEKELDICYEESKIKWKMNDKEPKNDLPFNYYSLITYLTGKQKKYDSPKSSNKNSSGSDLLSFYRSLLGLKLRFSQIELKNAYREAVGKYHPDRYGALSSRDRENAEMLMRQVNEAYEKLKEIAE
jgi:curved DNA-binding protein CbpA